MVEFNIKEIIKKMRKMGNKRKVRKVGLIFGKAGKIWKKSW